MGTFPDVKRTFMSLSCMHCESPLCAASCPQGAIAKREEDGLVVVDKAKCTGDKWCATACPFDVPRYGDKKVMDKCDACLSLGRKRDEAPRCVNTCPTKALHFGSIESMEALAVKKGGRRMEGYTVPSVFVASAETRSENQ